MVACRYEISLLVLKKYFSRSLRSILNFFQHSKRNFVSPRGHVISSIYYYFQLFSFLYTLRSKNNRLT